MSSIRVLNITDQRPVTPGKKHKTLNQQTRSKKNGFQGDS